MVHKLLSNQTVRFVITGGGAAVLYYLLCLLFTTVLHSSFWGAFVAYAFAFMVAYTVQHAWTFEGKHDHSGSLPRYLIAQLCAALVASLAAKQAGMSGFHPAIVSLVATLVGSSVSYILARFWVFAEKRERQPAI